MREMKFRAWHKILKNYAHIKRIWLDGDGNGHDEIFAVSDVETTYPIHEVVLEQYTGLKDKNGKEIYEGDIVSEEFVYRDEKVITIWQVRWCDDECAFELHYVSGFEVDDCSLDADEEDYKVIGNIHENPELLEEECTRPQAE